MTTARRVTLLCLLALGFTAAAFVPPVPIALPGIGWVIGSTNPFTESGLHVLIVEETDDRAKLTAAQQSILTSVAVREAAAGGQFRILDPNAPLENAEPVWQAAMKLKRDSIPWLYVGNGSKGYSGPLPVDSAAVIAIIQGVK